MNLIIFILSGKNLLLERTCSYLFLHFYSDSFLGKIVGFLIILGVFLCLIGHCNGQLSAQGTIFFVWLLDFEDQELLDGDLVDVGAPVLTG